MKNLLQTGCLVLAILCILYYAAIVVYAGLNTSFSWIWIFGAVLFLFLWRLLVYQSTHPGSRLRYVIITVGVLVAIGVAAAAVIGSRIVGAMVSRPEPDMEYVVVLGAQVRGTAPSRALRKRLDRAVSYAEDNPQAVFILSGGQGPDEGISEAQCMYNYMVEKGVPAKRLLLEERSTSTKENLQFSNELYDIKEKKVGIISNNFHIYRALGLAEKEGYTKLCGIPAASDIGMQPHNILREICCVLVEIVRGNLSL